MTSFARFVSRRMRRSGARALSFAPPGWQAVAMLLSGINHVAVLTADTERFLEFYNGVFGATHEVLQDRGGFKLTLRSHSEPVLPRPSWAGG